MGIRDWLSKAVDVINETANEVRIQQKLKAWTETKSHGYGYNYNRLSDEGFESTGGGLRERDLTVLYLWSQSGVGTEDRELLEIHLRNDPQIKSRLNGDKRVVSGAATALAKEFCEAVDQLGTSN